MFIRDEIIKILQQAEKLILNMSFIYRESFSKIGGKT